MHAHSCTDKLLLLLLDGAHNVRVHLSHVHLVADVRYGITDTECFTKAHLCGNACMICAWQPQCGPVTHPCKTCHDVLQRDKHGMPHMQPASHVGGRHGHGKWLAFACVLWLKHAILFPPATSKSVLIGTSQEDSQDAEPRLKLTRHTSHRGAALCQQYRNSWAKSFWLAQHLCKQVLCHALSSVWHVSCTASEAHFRSKWLSKSGLAGSDHDICLPSPRYWSGMPNAMKALAESIQTHLRGRPLAQLIVHRAL